MIGAEWSGVLPLRIRGSIAFADRDPSVFASRGGGPLVLFLNPQKKARRFRPMAFPRFIIVGKREINRFEPGGNFWGNVFAATGRIGIAPPAIIFGPFLVP